MLPSTVQTSKDELQAADGDCKVQPHRKQGDTGPGIQQEISLDYK